MAAATVVFTPESKASGATVHAVGDMWDLIGTLTFAGDYATGGISLDLTKYLPAGVTKVIPMGSARGLDMEYDLTNKKLKLWGNTSAAAVAEHTNATTIDTDITGAVVPVIFRLY